MSQRELRRVEVLARVRSKQLRIVDASRLMHVSYRQAKRLWSRYRVEGAVGLMHRSAGRPSHHALVEKFRKRVLQLVGVKYGGAVGERFGARLAAEHLSSEDGLKIDAETLRRWMLAEGLWSRERKGWRHRRRRERKEHFGELVQMDGSFHAWLEERGPEGCLIDMVDDATNITWAQLGEEETIWAAADALRAWIERYGVPLALYVDWKNLYKRRATPGERLRGEEPITQFGRMCAKLGIEIIAANSPQAKGRVERVHGTHQDRLVKKLRRRAIGTHEVANVYLEREYLPEHNRAAIDRDGLARYHTTRVRDEPNHCADKIGRRQVAMDRLPALYHLKRAVDSLAKELARAVGQHRAWRQRVDADPIASELAGQPAGQSDHRRFRGRVVQRKRRAVGRGKRGKVDDAAAARLPHRRHHRLAAVPDPLD